MTPSQEARLRELSLDALHTKQVYEMHAAANTPSDLDDVAMARFEFLRAKLIVLVAVALFGFGFSVVYVALVSLPWQSLIASAFTALICGIMAMGIYEDTPAMTYEERIEK